MNRKKKQLQPQTPMAVIIVLTSDASKDYELPYQWAKDLYNDGRLCRLQDMATYRGMPAFAELENGVRKY